MLLRASGTFSVALTPFQSLIGRLVTRRPDRREDAEGEFQSLIGRLVTSLFSMPGTRIPVAFQSLIGRLVTRISLSFLGKKLWFQSLIGRLVTTRTRTPCANCRAFQSLIGRLVTWGTSGQGGYHILTSFNPL